MSSRRRPPPRRIKFRREQFSKRGSRLAFFIFGKDRINKMNRILFPNSVDSVNSVFMSSEIQKPHGSIVRQAQVIGAVAGGVLPIASIVLFTATKSNFFGLTIGRLVLWPTYPLAFLSDKFDWGLSFYKAEISFRSLNIGTLCLFAVWNSISYFLIGTIIGWLIQKLKKKN